jgi:Putative Flp pilus-assembly TadE/G-like
MLTRLRGPGPVSDSSLARRGASKTCPLRAIDCAGGSGGSPPRNNTERGTIAVFTVVFAIAVVLLTALIVDGGIAMNARERAADIAEQAARAAAGHVDVARLRASGRVVIAPGACGLAASLIGRYAAGASSGVDAVTGAAMTRCVAPPGAATATVGVSITTRPLIGGILGGFTETAHESATALCGITRGVRC